MCPEKEPGPAENGSVSPDASARTPKDASPAATSNAARKSPDAESVRPDAAGSTDSEKDSSEPHGAPESASAAPRDSDDSQDDEKDGKNMGLLDHLSELRQRLVKAAIAAAIGFAACWVYVDEIFNLLMAPLLTVLPEGTHAQYTTLPEAFFARVRVAFVGGLFFSSPLIFYQIWSFVAPGLYDEEKRYILPIAFLSALFFIGGGIFCYFIVFPFAFNFFISYSTPEIVITPKISDYLSFCLKLMFAFGLIFEMPIFTFFLARLGILTADMMRRSRKYAIVGIFILAAILTPPDVVSQLLMACPMLLLYEISIGVAAIFGRRRSPKENTDFDNEQEQQPILPAQGGKETDKQGDPDSGQPGA